MLLEVYCGPTSTNITETTYDYTQSAEVGSLHGFYFTNFSSFSDCPVFTYQITTTTDRTVLHPDFELANNVSLTVQAGLMRARVKNTKVEATYTFKILAIAEGGYEHWTGVRTMKYVCDPTTYSIQMAPDFAKNLTYYKGTSGQYATLLFSAFSTRHLYCKVNRYEIDNNNDAAT